MQHEAAQEFQWLSSNITNKDLLTHHGGVAGESSVKVPTSSVASCSQKNNTSMFGEQECWNQTEGRHLLMTQQARSKSAHDHSENCIWIVVSNRGKCSDRDCEEKKPAKAQVDP